MSTWCKVPITLKTGDHVPCGSCPDCTARRISGWSFRLMMEEKYCSAANFITLTYAPENVCYSPVGGRLTLVKSHVQCFIKKLRRLTPWPDSIRYFAVGEYGTVYSRPHYHVLLFNVSQELVQPAWQYGQIHYGQVNKSSVGYCLKYMCKERKIPEYQKDDRVPEFGLFSKGLGQSYITPEVVLWHKDDLCGRMYIPLEGGLKIAMPRYFKEKIYTPGERRFFELNYLKNQFKENKRTYQSENYSIRLKAIKELRGQMESFNAAVKKKRNDYFGSRSSIF